jgi:hypothetical protein
MGGLSLPVARYFEKNWTTRIYPFSAPPVLGMREFLYLSQKITDKADLDSKTAEKILQLFSENLQDRRGLFELFDFYHSPNSELSSTQLQLYLDLLSTWYTGIFSRNGVSLRLTYLDALMYSPTQGIKNIPSTPGGAPGFWALPPTPQEETL